MTTDYVPIDCDQHSVLELLAMGQARVSLCARQASGGDLRLSGQVTDVVTRNGAEYLLVRGEARELLSIRLDRLLAIDAADGTAIWRQKSAAN